MVHFITAEFLLASKPQPESPDWRVECKPQIKLHFSSSAYCSELITRQLFKCVMTFLTRPSENSPNSNLSFLISVNFYLDNWEWVGMNLSLSRDVESYDMKAEMNLCRGEKELETLLDIAGIFILNG